jgi:hypothetical protein
MAMKSYLFAAAAFAMIVATVGLAQEVKPPPGKGGDEPAKASDKALTKGNPFGGQPDRKFGGEPGFKGPGGGDFSTALMRVTATKMATLEEEFETIEAHRDVRRAHVRAAEVTLRGTEVQLEILAKSPANTIPQSEMMKAKLEVDAAKAQLEIKMAELKEVEVKLKFAKKRLEDAKAAGVRPLPVRPVQVDPPPPQ